MSLSLQMLLLMVKSVIYDMWVGGDNLHSILLSSQLASSVIKEKLTGEKKKQKFNHMFTSIIPGRSSGKLSNTLK